jgi:thiol-disulfide isomerase/thioredoxin
METLQKTCINRRRVSAPGTALLLALSAFVTTSSPCAAPADIDTEQESSAANTAPTLARIWAERSGGSQANTAMEKVLDNLREAISRALTPDHNTIGLTDQNSKTWTLADLKGKTTLVNLWFTSCGPCRLELPYLERIHKQIKDRGVMQVVTVNVDRDADVARRFLNDNHYTIPVVFAWSIAQSADGIVAPATWILDARGIARLEDVGFEGDGELWVKRTLAQMESVRSSGR